MTFLSAMSIRVCADMRQVQTELCIPCQKRIGYPLKGLQLFDKMENSHCQSQEEEPLEQKDKGEMIRPE